MGVTLRELREVRDEMEELAEAASLWAAMFREAEWEPNEEELRLLKAVRGIEDWIEEWSGNRFGA